MGIFIKKMRKGHIKKSKTNESEKLFKKHLEKIYLRIDGYKISQYKDVYILMNF